MNNHKTIPVRKLALLRHQTILQVLLRKPIWVIHLLETVQSDKALLGQAPAPVAAPLLL